MNRADTLTSIYMMLNQLEIKATPENTKILSSVYAQLENIVKEIRKENEKEVAN